jgi:hypothetical protein
VVASCRKDSLVTTLSNFAPAVPLGTSVQYFIVLLFFGIVGRSTVPGLRIEHSCIFPLHLSASVAIPVKFTRQVHFQERNVAPQHI